MWGSVRRQTELARVLSDRPSTRGNEEGGKGLEWGKKERESSLGDSPSVTLLTVISLVDAEPGILACRGLTTTE